MNWTIASENDLAKVIYESGFDGDGRYPWETQSASERMTFQDQARGVLRKFVVLIPPSAFTPAERETP